MPYGIINYVNNGCLLSVIGAALLFSVWGIAARIYMQKTGGTYEKVINAAVSCDIYGIVII